MRYGPFTVVETGLSKRLNGFPKASQQLIVGPPDSESCAIELQPQSYPWEESPWQRTSLSWHLHVAGSLGCSPWWLFSQLRQTRRNSAFLLCPSIQKGQIEAAWGMSWPFLGKDRLPMSLSPPPDPKENFTGLGAPSSPVQAGKGGQEQCFPRHP